MAIRRGSPSGPPRRSVGQSVAGRGPLVKWLTARVLDGATVALIGPVGIGKTWLLSRVAERVESTGRPWGLTRQTVVLADVESGLRQAYPEVALGGAARTARARLRLAAESRPGVLLLDHLGQLVAPARGFLRTLRSGGTGVVLAADVAHERDLVALRALRLAHVERDVPPLARSAMRALLVRAQRTRRIPMSLEDAERLLDVSRGRPGRLLWFLAELGAGRGWRGSSVMPDRLAAEALIAEGQLYVERGICARR